MTNMLTTCDKNNIGVCYVHLKRWLYVPIDELKQKKNE